MAQKYLILEGPEGLLNFELVTLLGFLLVDSNFRLKLLATETEGGSAAAKEAAQEYLGEGLSEVNGENTGHSGGDLMAHWGTKGPGKATIDDLLSWASTNKSSLDKLMENLKTFLNTKYPPSEQQPEDNYSQCDFNPHDVIELLESARFMSWRRL
jgi:hypothetical protein